MQLRFENNIFTITVTGCNRPVSNVRVESEIVAHKLYNKNNKIILGLSGGLDSQIVLHSFHCQSIPLTCAFFYMPGFNDVEYNNVQLLKDKYNLDLNVIDLNPNTYKDELIEGYQTTGIPPFQLLHKKFLEQLPVDYDFIMGLDGPDLVFKNNTWNIMQTANSFVNSRSRAMQMLDRSGRIIAWEKVPEILSSILNDDVITSYMCAHNYINNNGLSYQHDKSILLIDHFDLYMKPFLYGKYWGDTLEYFPKYQGPENVDWIMNTKWHDYRKNVIFLPYAELVNNLRYDQTIYYQETR